MKRLEKIKSSKFPLFNSNEIISTKLVFGGYRGETTNNSSCGGGPDQIKQGIVDCTANGSGTRNDGFN